MIWFGAVGFRGQPGQPKPPTRNDWRILKSSDKKRNLITTLLPICVLWDQPHKPYQIQLGRFFVLGHKKLIRTNYLISIPKLPLFTRHHWFLPLTLRSTRFFLFGAAKSQPRRLLKRSGLGHHQIQRAKYKILCFQGLFGSEVFSSNIWELKKIGLLKVWWSFFSWQLGGFRITSKNTHIHIHQVKKKMGSIHKRSGGFTKLWPNNFLGVFLRWETQNAPHISRVPVTTSWGF